MYEMGAVKKFLFAFLFVSADCSYFLLDLKKINLTQKFFAINIDFSIFYYVCKSKLNFISSSAHQGRKITKQIKNFSGKFKLSKT